MVKFLITRKANVNLAEPCGGYTALHYAGFLENISMMELLMSKGAKHDMRDKAGLTPLHCSVARGHKEAVACLLDHGADINAVHIWIHKGRVSYEEQANDEGAGPSASSFTKDG